MSKILMIDDDPMMLDMLQEDLEDAGYLILKATTPQEAFRIFQDTRPDLVIMDIIMPGADGLELLKQFKETGISFKSMMLSGLNNDDLKKTALEIGADSYFLKPMDLDRFKAVVEKLLRK